MAEHEKDCMDNCPDCPCNTCRKDNYGCCLCGMHYNLKLGCNGDEGDCPDYEPEETEGRGRMKPIPKDTLNELARLTRKYRRTGDTDILDKRIKKAQEISRAVYGDEWLWLCFADFVGAIVGTSGMAPAASNETIYKAFEAVGLSVQADTEEPPKEDADA